ncbi:MAG TPA: secretin N-terminal domain-containing protein [Terriglobales bacterium]|nr:secretin N-terminal domain-containing protein [Terriglobales bacterium]
MFKSILVLLLALTCAAPALHAGDKGAPYFRHGQQSMQTKNYDQAYADFQKAAELSPDNVEYQIATQRAQFAAANLHIRKGEEYKASKNYELAQKEMERAIAIDPSNFVASQELQAIKDLIHPPPPPPGEAVGSAAVASLQERLARAAGPVELGPVANTIIRDFTVNSDPKNAYLAAGKLAGLNVIFDASSQGGYSNSGRVSLDLHNLTLLEILRVLDVATDSFYTPITSNTILVANNSVQKHQAVDPTVLKVFYVKNVQAPTDLTELAQAIRGLMQPQPHIVPVASVNALVMRDTPDKVAMVQKLLDDLDKAPPEVVVDVRILQVNRDHARDLGLLPPTSFSIGLQAPASSTSNNSNNNNGSNTNGTGTPTTTTNSPTLNELTHLSSSNFSVTIPNATLNALLNDSNTQTIQEPELRAIQGQKATLQIGQKIPVATGSFQPGIGGVGINPLVNTQFTQQPVGVNIDMTPQIHGDDSVLLKERIEISNVDGYVNLGGIQQPIIGNRVIDHTIELRNGQSSVLGGMMVNTVTHNVNGIPGLSQIPLFKYLFSSTHDETQHTEIVIVLTPHIVHSLQITRQDERALATGTQDDLQLRELPPATLQPAAPATTNPQPSAPAAPPAPAPAGPQLVVAPARPEAQVGKPFTVSLDLRQAKNAYALTFQLNYDPKLLSVEAMNLGGFLSSDSKVPALVHREDADTGTAQVSLSRPPNAGGLSGAGTVLTVTFMPKAAGESPLTVSRLGARGPDGAPQPLQAASATITIKQ